MKLTIGENIRSLRREKDITQEEFASIFGVSYQSVSRWEKGVCYPDMELLPDIAAFFGISVDKLMGADKAIEEKDVEEYVSRFKTALNKGLVYDCIGIAREGVAAYPNNYVLLNKLMLGLFISGDSSGNIAEWEDNIKKNDAEIIALGERIIKYCPDQNIRLEATARLAFQHCLIGRKEMGRKLFDTLPSADNCRENCIWPALEEDETEAFVRKKIKADYESLRSYVWYLASSECTSVENQIKIFEKVFKLEELMTDGNTIKNDWGHCRLYFEIAGCYLKLNDMENALKYIELCLKHAKLFDERPEVQTYSSIVFGDITEKRSDFETTDSRPLSEIVIEDWLNDKNISESKELSEILSRF